MKKSKNGKTRNKPGYRETDRLCRLCCEMIRIDKCLNQHHLAYGDNPKSREKNRPHPPRRAEIRIPLHYNCHNVVHCRVRFHHPYMKKYGIDFGPVAAAFAVLNLYKPVMEEALDYIKKIDKIGGINGKR